MMENKQKYYILGGVILLLAAFVWIRGKSSSSQPQTNSSGTSYSPSDLINSTAAQQQNAYNYDPTTGQFTGNGQADPYYSFFTPTPVFTATPSGQPPAPADLNNALYGSMYITGTGQNETLNTSQLTNNSGYTYV